MLETRFQRILGNSQRAATLDQQTGYGPTRVAAVLPSVIGGPDQEFIADAVSPRLAAARTAATAETDREPCSV
jgi:hypothetical protein